MPLEIIPTIYLRAGKSVRLQIGAYGTESRIAEEPIKAAQRFVSEGATRLHIIDMDAARTGDSQNLVTIREIIKRVPSLAVQVCGGIRTRERAVQVLSLGVARVAIETTIARADIAMIGSLLHQYGDRIIICVDNSQGCVVVDDLLSHIPERTEEFGLRLARMGATRFLFTDIDCEENEDGVNAQSTAAFTRTVGRPTLASGVVGPDDIKILTTLQPKGVEGVIIGKALHSGALTVFDALMIAAAGEARLRTQTSPPPDSTGPLPDWVREAMR